MPRTESARVTTRPDPSQRRDDGTRRAAPDRAGSGSFAESKPMDDAIAEQRPSRGVPSLCSWSSVAGGTSKSGGGR